MYSVLTRKTLYSDLISEIKKVKKYIVIDAYIWINDKVGQSIAATLLEAADNGIKVYIRKDLSGSIFEHTPGRIPFFVHKEEIEKRWKNFWNPKFFFMTPRNFNTMAFYIYGKKSRPEIIFNSLFEKMSQHKNIFIDNLPLFNHGKLILLDNIAYVGGQCISNDYTQWKDYNIKIKNTTVVKNILNQIIKGEVKNNQQDLHFLQNIFPQKKSIFHFMKDFIDNIENGEALFIEMSYFGMWFFPIIKKALKRGVKITILASKSSDTNHHTNMWFLSKFLKIKNQKISIFFSEDMIHTKGLVTSKKVILGAANFHSTCGYFQAFNEQNIISENKKLIATILRCFKKDLQNATMIHSVLDLPTWNKFSAILEIAFLYISSYFVFFNKRKIQRWRAFVNQKIERSFFL